ncbi:MAG TPA: PEGA domain-containing protein [Vicinamibacterales bacterium]|nr:PEGA domain-containing protein [Vicinamibacterales bacterium]
MDASESKARRYTPGPSDGLGDRLLTSDTGTSPALELLRFKPEFATAPGFESALRKRLDLLGHVRHPAFAVVRAVESGEHLALVSNKAAGIRLSEILRDAKGSAFAFELIRQIAPALAMLHEHGAEISHGAVTPERIVVTKEGRLVLIEHVLGQALQSLELTVGRARTEIGLAVPDGTGPVTIDQRLDVIQLGFIALSLALGRRLQPSEYPSRIRATLDEFTRADAATSAKLRPWLERALQVGPRGFSNAKEANEAYIELMTPAPTPTVQTPDPDLPDGQVWHEPAGSDSPQAEDTTAAASSATSTTTPVTVRAKSGRWIKIALAGLGVIAVVEGAVIAGLFNTLLGTAQAPVVIPPPQPVAEVGSSTGATDATGTTGVGATGALGATPSADPAAAVSSPAQTPAAASNAVVPPPVSTPPATQTQPPPVTTAGTAALPPVDPAAPPAPPRVGTLQVTSRIELQIFEKGQLIGTSGSAITLPRGTHQLEFVNETLGFRATQTVNMRLANTPVSVAVPNGRISINAVPWAEVWIDGNPAGQTPLANLAIPIGQHEIVFRHPQLGEQRQTAVVKVEGLTRVSATLQGSR